jgi:hypothetical protein
MKYLRFFIQPPSKVVLRSWSYANAYEERRFAPFLPFRRVVPITFRRWRATRPDAGWSTPTLVADVRGRPS